MHGAFDKLRTMNGRAVLFLMFFSLFIIANVVRILKLTPWNCGVLTATSGSVILFGFVLAVRGIPALSSILMTLGGFAMEIYILAEPIKVALRLVQGRCCSVTIFSFCMMFFVSVIGAFVLAKLIHRIPLAAMILFGTPRKAK